MDDFGSKPLHEYLREHAQRHPDRAAIIWYGRTITYAELDEWSGRVGAVFQNWGVHSGDHVALYMGNCPEYLMAFLGAQKLGAVVSPVSSSFKSWELAYQLQDSVPRFWSRTNGCSPSGFPAGRHFRTCTCWSRITRIFYRSTHRLTVPLPLVTCQQTCHLSLGPRSGAGWCLQHRRHQIF